MPSVVELGDVRCETRAVQLTEEDCWRRLRLADHAVLCTSNKAGAVDAVPVCFAVVGTAVASPIDRVKPKETMNLARLRNLDRDATATLLCEHWDRQDWSALWWVRAHLARRSRPAVANQLIVESELALKEKYPQYRESNSPFDHVIVFDVQSVTGWSA